MQAYIAQIAPKLGNIKYNIDLILEKIDNAIEKNSDIIIFPELALSGSLLKEIIYDVAIDKMPAEILDKSKEIDILIGAPELGEDDYYYNTAYYLSDGKILGKHRKIYTNNKYVNLGENLDIIETKFGKVGILLGREICHQSATYILAQKGAKIIFSLTSNIVILGNTKEDIGKMYKMVAQANSYTNNLYTLVVNRAGREDSLTYSGNSYLVNPMGEISYEMEYLKEEEMNFEIEFDMIRRAKRQKNFARTENKDLIKRELEEIIK